MDLAKSNLHELDEKELVLVNGGKDGDFAYYVGYLGAVAIVASTALVTGPVIIGTIIGSKLSKLF